MDSETLSPRDYQCSRLYRAEREAAAFLRDPLPTIGELQGYVDSILNSRWMQMRFGSFVLAPITVRNGADAVPRPRTFCPPSQCRSG